MISSTNDFCIFLVIEWAQNKYCLSEHIHTPTTNRIELIARNRVKIKKRNKAFVYVIISTYGKKQLFWIHQKWCFKWFFCVFFVFLSSFFRFLFYGYLCQSINTANKWYWKLDSSCGRRMTQLSLLLWIFWTLSAPSNDYCIDRIQYA